MARSQQSAVSIRLATEGGEVVKRDFDGIAQSGKRAFEVIENAAREVNPALRAVNAAAVDVKSEMQAFAGHAGIAGRALTALGPGGVIAAAGVGATALAISNAIGIARDAVRDFGDLHDTIESLGVGSDLFQGVSFAALQGGINPQGFESAMRTFVTVTGQVEAGVGRVITRLRSLDPELLKVLRSAAPLDDKIRGVADAMAREDDVARRAAIATTLFGDTGLRMASVLAGGSTAVDGFIAKAKEMGLIISRDLLDSADKMSDQFDVAAKVIDLNLKQAFIGLAPVIATTMQEIGAIAHVLDLIVDKVKEISAAVLDPTEDLSKVNAAIEQTIARMDQARSRSDWDRAALGLPSQEDELATYQKALDSLYRRQATLMQQASAPPPVDTDAALRNAGQFDAIAKQIAGSLDAVATKEEKIAAVRQETADLVAQLDALHGKSGVDGAQIDKAIADANEAMRRKIEALDRAGTKPPGGSRLEADNYDKVTKALQDQIAALTMIDREKAIAAEVAKLSARATDAERQSVEALAGALYDQTAAAKAASDRMAAIGDSAKDFAKGFVSDLRSGTDAVDALGNALDRLADKLIDNALDDLVNNILGNLGGGSGGGGASTSSGFSLSSIADFIGSLFGGGKAGGGPLDPGKWYIAGEHGQEPIWGGGAGAFAMGYPSSSGKGETKIAVNVIDNAGVKVATEQRTDDSGGVTIDVLIDQAVARHVGNLNSKTGRALAASVGARGELTKR